MDHQKIYIRFESQTTYMYMRVQAERLIDLAGSRQALANAQPST